MRMNKRAVSPLIATVLLIAFAVALGAIVMSWGKDYVEETQDTVTTKSSQARICTLDTSIKVHKLGGKPSFCVTEPTDPSAEKTITFILDNRGDVIDDIKVAVIGDIDVYNNQSVLGATVDLDEATTKKITLKAPSTEKIGSIEQVIITPKIQVEGASEGIYCAQAQIELDRSESTC